MKPLTKKVVCMNSRGIGLLELMLSLIVISVLMVGALSYYRVTSESQKVNSTVHMVGGLLVASEYWFETYLSFTSGSNGAPISVKSLVEQGKLPKSFCSNEDCTQNHVNPWGGDVIVSPVDDSHVRILLTDLPVSDSSEGICQQLTDLLKDQVVGDCAKAQEGIFSGVYPRHD